MLWLTIDKRKKRIRRKYLYVFIYRFIQLKQANKQAKKKKEKGNTDAYMMCKRSHHTKNNQNKILNRLTTDKGSQKYATTSRKSSQEKNTPTPASLMPKYIHTRTYPKCIIQTHVCAYVSLCVCAKQ